MSPDPENGHGDPRDENAPPAFSPDEAVEDEDLEDVAGGAAPSRLGGDVNITSTMMWGMP